MAETVIAVLNYTTQSKDASENLVSNSNVTQPQLLPTDKPEGGAYLSIRRMTNGNFEQFVDNNYMICYEGYRMDAPSEPKSYQLSVSTYKEDLNIATPFGQIHATAIYPDAGSTSDTTVSFVEFLVTGASGAFSGAKTILIEYSNKGDAPWAKDANGKSVERARRMTVMGDAQNRSSRIPSRRMLM